MGQDQDQEYNGIYYEFQNDFINVICSFVVRTKVEKEQ